MPSESRPAPALASSRAEHKLGTSPGGDSHCSSKPPQNGSGFIQPGLRNGAEANRGRNSKIDQPKVTPSGLTISKQWVLPPRPKPGRKPKPKPAPSDKPQRPRTASGYSQEKHEVHVKSRAPIDEPKHEPKHEPKLEKNSEGMQHKHIPEDEESCSLCSKEDCMCETIGLKPDSKRGSLPSLEMILNTVDIKMDAVPLKRRATTQLGVSPYVQNSTSVQNSTTLADTGRSAVVAAKPKFTRLSDMEPMQPTPLLSVPSPLEGFQYSTDGCGFCTENTPCACAETSASANSSVIASASAVDVNASVMGFPVSTPTSPRRFSGVQINSTSPARSGTAHGVNLQQGVTAVPSSAGGSTGSIGSASTRFMNQTPPEEDYGCSVCQKEAMSMLFCVSLSSAEPLSAGSVAIPCHLAVKTLQKHPRFATCDLGRLIRRLEVRAKQVGVQSINRVLQELERGEFS